MNKAEDKNSSNFFIIIYTMIINNTELFLLYCNIDLDSWKNFS